MRAAAALCLLVAFSTPAEALGAYERQELTISDRHPKVILAPRGGTEATLVIRFRAGAVDDGEAPGLTRLSQHVMLEANQRSSYRALVEELYGSAASLKMETGLRESSFTLTAPRAAFPGLAKRLLSMVLSPIPTNGTFEEAVARTLNDEKIPGRGTDLETMIATSVVTDWRYHNEPYGERDSLERLDLDDVRAHLKGPLAPANATVVIAGAFEPAPLVAVLTKLSGGKRRPADRPEVTLPRQFLIRSGREIHLLALPITVASEKAGAAVRLMTTLLGERVQRELRSLGLTYSTAVFHVRTEWLDFIAVLLPVQASGQPRIGGHLAEQLAVIREGRFSAEELERNRRATLARLAEMDASSELLAYALAGGGTDWYGPGMVEAVRSMTAAELVAQVAPWLDERRRIHIYLSSRQDILDLTQETQGAR